MSDFYGGKSINKAREESRRAAYERFETQKRLRAELQERERQAAKAARKPVHEEMQEMIDELTRKVEELQPGDPRAVAMMRTYMLQLLLIAAYMLDITAPLEEALRGQETQGR